jgi:diguanylate cyclase (GGDEF)-like protein
MLIPVAAVAAIGVAGFRTSVGGLETFRSETVDEGVLIENLTGLLAHADDIGPIYVENQDPAEGARFDALAERIDQAFDALEALASSEQDAPALYSRQLWLQAIQEVRIAVAFPHGPVEDRLDRFHDRIDEASATIAHLYAINLNQVSDEISSLQERESKQLLAFLATLFVSTIAAYLLARRLRRSIMTPLLSLERGAARVGDDDLSHRLPVEGDDELARVSEAFNTMAANVQETRDQLHHQALHDPLTGLPNRTLFMDRMHHAIARADRRNTPMSVLYLDLDGFKTVNDTRGHEAGDQVLVAVAGHLTKALRAEDSVARLGGDEFAVLLEEGRPGAIRTAERIMAAFKDASEKGSKSSSVTASIGIATLEDGQELDELLRQADAAMYAAKAEGKARWQVFGSGPGSDVQASQTLRAELQRAIERSEFVIHFQPIVKLDSGAILSVEALVRWNHPTRGILLPADFLQEAEDAGHILFIDRWVLREACRQVRTWRDRVPEARDLSVNVNISARHLQSPGLNLEVKEALQLSGLGPENLTLEITETSLVHDHDTAVKELGELKSMGVQIALDDFGTGYSSLRRLLDFPIDAIKIDRGFVSDLGARDQRSELVRALVNLGETLGLRVVAEGIETETQIDYLRLIRCEQGQGFLFAKPLAAELMESLLRVGCSVREVEPASAR